MGFVPLEKLTDVVENPYEAILIAAKEARVQNSIAALQDLDPSINHPKVTSMALQSLIDGEVQYHYEEEAEAAESEAKEEAEDDE